jgi:hypothetical protein
VPAVFSLPDYDRRLCLSTGVPGVRSATEVVDLEWFAGWLPMGADRRWGVSPRPEDAESLD